MQRLSESVQRKFIDVIALDDWEIETPSGWQPVSKIMKTVKYRRWRLVLENGYILDGADQHIVITQDGERFLEDIVPGEYVCTNAGLSRVVMCVNTGIDEHMYDVEVDDDAHLYYSNGIVSHNTTVAAGYILHQLIFNKTFTVAILANKGAQAREIIERVQLMYEELPFFLQPGVKVWNKGSITLGNKSRAFTAATSSSSVRGKSINLLYMDEFAHIENDVGFYQSTYPVIMSGKTTKVIITSTPNGMNLFYKMWTEAKEKRNQFEALQIYWHEHPDRDDEWLREQEMNMPPKQIAQEVHCVVGETKAVVQCVISGEIFDTTMEELYSKQYEREGVVYKVTRVDGLSYIGISLDYKKRIREHSKSTRFEKGISASEILFSGPYSECERLESFFIRENNTYHAGLNVTPDGKGKNKDSKFNTLGIPCSPETRAKISRANIGKKSTGPKHTVEQKAKWSEMRRGTNHRHKLKISNDDVLRLLSEYDHFTPTRLDISHRLAKKYRESFLSGKIGIDECRLSSGQVYSKKAHFADTRCQEFGVTRNAVIKRMFGA